MSLDAFNAMDTAAAREALAMCCVSERWVDGMLAARPFATPAALAATADTLWAALTEEDYLQAFAGHPKIGDLASLEARYAHTGMLAAGEQSGAAQADAEVLRRLAAGNRAYEERFGFIFIVCATGKSAAQMCELLEARLHNSRAQELEIAAEEQRRILQLRLEKLL